MAQVHVSVREFKSRLSHFLRLATAGESVVITDRGVPVGRIVPVGPRVEERLDAMRRSGDARWSGRKLAPRKAAGKVRGRRTVAQVLVQDRG